MFPAPSLIVEKVPWSHLGHSTLAIVYILVTNYLNSMVIKSNYNWLVSADLLLLNYDYLFRIVVKYEFTNQSFNSFKEHFVLKVFYFAYVHHYLD